jgi:hypothetical protein
MHARPLGYVQQNSSNILAKPAMFQPQPTPVGLGAWRISGFPLTASYSWANAESG